MRNLRNETNKKSPFLVNLSLVYGKATTKTVDFSGKDWSSVFIHDFWFQVEKELDSLSMSEVPESNEKKGALVMKIKHNLISKLRVLLFNNTSDTQ